jgi:thiamine transport system ATP-binding protein
LIPEADVLHLDKIVLAQGSFQLTADWAVKAGQSVAIIGPSGSGKSTLLNAIAGFFVPKSGAVRWQGQDLADVSPGARPVSILFQDQNLFPHLTIAQNLGLGIRPDLRLSGDQHARVTKALERVGLSGLGDRRPSQMSGGQNGRAALARALLRARPVLLLDEPFAALGPALKSEMLALVKEITGEAGTTVLMVTHDPRDAEGSVDQVVFVDDGTAHAPLATRDVFAHPSPALARYLGR